jgi:hypothetical protein
MCLRRAPEKYIAGAALDRADLYHLHDRLSRERLTDVSDKDLPAEAAETEFLRGQIILYSRLAHDTRNIVQPRQLRELLYPILGS